MTAYPATGEALGVVVEGLGAAATPAGAARAAGGWKPRAGAGGRRPAAPIQWQTLSELGSAYWFVVVAGGVFTLARFSEAFLILRAQQQGLPDTYAPLVMVVM